MLEHTIVSCQADNWQLWFPVGIYSKALCNFFNKISKQLYAGKYIFLLDKLKVASKILVSSLTKDCIGKLIYTY